MDRQVFNQVVAGARQFLLELCVPGHIQESYLEHSPCYLNVSLSENKCAPFYRRLVQVSKRVDERKDVDHSLRESCCAFNEFVLCKYIHGNQDCGQEAAIFLQRHLDPSPGPYLKSSASGTLRPLYLCCRLLCNFFVFYQLSIPTLFTQEHHFNA
ncbi:uncharacterized protein TNIN_281521 [Trichonephila inaurata madagascariensis]|uniref:Uncharacterized protein n=1 Tax=Trichonephila inaurata madagascariensis TaxID=2747483 RepID=A0A8X6KG06_9ARAC|nr:uncharacterized protein TNIN_281521 [Trichonephila inaurata madagascariensis]